MADTVSYPKDLAEFVTRKLSESRSQGLRTKALTSLLEIAFFSSLKTEEGQPIISALSCLDPENPDPDPPRNIRPDRWQFSRFREPLPLTGSNLVKLAKAADPRASLLAVYPNC